jgi:general secretion pathway protein K
MALVAVLGFLAVMSVVAISVVSLTRSSIGAAVRHGDRVAAQAAVDGAVAQAVYELVSAHGVRPRILAGPTQVRIGIFEVTVQVRPEAAKIDLNAADPVLLAGFFHAAGASNEAADHIGDAIADWRDADDLIHLNGAELPEYQTAGLSYGPANKLFESVRELRRVLGVTDALYSCVKADVTVYSQRAGVDLDAASPLVRRAAGLDSEAPANGTRGAVSVATGQSIAAGDVFEIVAILKTSTLRRGVRTIVRITGNARDPYWTLAYDGGSDWNEPSTCASRVATLP